MHRIMVGDFELTIFSDGTYPLDGGAFFGVIPKAMWSRKVDSDEKNYVTAGLNSLLIRTGKQNVLVETGMGNKLSERMVKIFGQPAELFDNLSGRHRPGHQHPPALRSLRLEYCPQPRWQNRPHFSARKILCAGGRMAVCSTAFAT